MTVRELIVKFQTLDPDLDVMIHEVGTAGPLDVTSVRVEDEPTRWPFDMPDQWVELKAVP